MARRLVVLGALLAGCTITVPRATSDVPGSEPAGGPAATRSSAPSAPASALPDASTPTAVDPSGTAPVPSGTATPDPQALTLDTTSCEGGVVLEWSPSVSPDFHHYSALRSPERDIAPDWPPVAPAVDWGDTYTTDRFITSGADASIIPSDASWFYRVVAYDAENRPVGSSPVVRGQLLQAADLGTTTVTPVDGGVRIGWEPYGGFSRCFTAYRVLYGTGIANTVLGTVTDQAADSLVSHSLHAGTTYAIRVEAIRATTLGSFVLGTSAATFYTVP
jgi:hypothetical protein